MVYVRVARSLETWLRHELRRWSGQTILYTYWLGPLTLGAARASRGRSDSVVVTRAHGGDIYEARYRPPYLPLRAATLRGADRVFPVSDDGRATLVAGRPWLGARCVTHRLGVPDPGTDAVPSTDGVLRVVTCAACRPVKRLELVVAGLSELARRAGAPDVQWDHYGDGPLRDALERQARAQLPDRVRWTFHGQVPNATVRGRYRAAPVDVLVNTSSSEGVPVTIMEAQSYGIPAAATAVGGTPEIVDPANGCLLSPGPTPAEVADALLALRPGAPGTDDRRLASKASWRARYRAEANYPAFAATLADLVADPGGARPGLEGDVVR